MPIEAKVDTGDLARLGREVDAATHRAVDLGAPAAATFLAVHARNGVPKRSGRLASSIVVRKTAAGAEVIMGTDYGGWIEYGGTRGRPYVAKGRYLGSGIPAAEALFGRATDEAMSALARSI